MSGRPDIYIVGGGIIGLVCAWKLAQQGMRVTVLERDHCGNGATQSSLGVLAAPSPLAKGPFFALHRTSLNMWEQFADELCDVSGLAVGYNRCGTLELLPTEPQHEIALKETTAVRTAGMECNGHPLLELLSPQEAAELEPGCIRSEYGALLNRSAALVSVEQLTQALRRACTNSSVEVREETLVQQLRTSGGRMSAVVCGQEVLPAENVLVTAGVWSGELHPEVARHAPVKPVRGQAALLESEQPCVRHIIKWKKGYVVPWSCTTAAIGSTTERRAGLDEQITLGGMAEIMPRAVEAVPPLASAKVVRLWAGLRPAPVDRKPYIGPVPGVTGLFTACGHYKVGFGMAPLTALAIADLLATGSTRYELEELYPRIPTEKKKRSAHG